MNAKVTSSTLNHASETKFNNFWQKHQKFAIILDHCDENQLLQITNDFNSNKASDIKTPPMNPCSILLVKYLVNFFYALKVSDYS